MLFRSGIISALQVLHALADTATPLARAAGGLSLFPQVLVNVPLRKPINLAASAKVKRAVRQAEADLGDEGRILLRPSGTEPVIRVMVEGSRRPQVQRWANVIAEAVRGA